jgi:uncharacterized membrane protein YciS (DUF1049 family)
MKIFKGTRFGRSIQRFSARNEHDPSPECNFLLTGIWIVSGILAVLVPLIYRTIHKRKYEELYMFYYWEQEMEEYEQQRAENYEMYGNNYNYQGAYTYDQMYNAQPEYIDVNNCHWYNVNCFSFFVNQEGEPMADQAWYPTWYSGWTTSEEDQRQMEVNREQPGSLKFVYIWQLFMFIAIMVYGTLVIRQNRNPAGLIVALLVWANYAFCTMWMLADGSIVTDGYIVKRSGFYGQVSVLIFMANFWYFIHGLLFCIVFWIRKMQHDKKERQIAETNKSIEKEESYQAPAEEPVAASSVQRAPPAATEVATAQNQKESDMDLLDAVFEPIDKACH